MGKKNKQENAYKSMTSVNSEVIENKGKYNSRVNHFINQSPYYNSCLDAFEKSDAIKKSPYNTAYDAAKKDKFVDFTDDTDFNDVIYGDYSGASIQAEVTEVKIEKAKPEKVKAKKTVQANYFKRRSVVMLLILLFSVVALAVPIVSSFEVLSDIDIDVDILNITDIFDNEIGMDMIKDNLTIIMLAAFMLFALLITIKALCAMFCKKKVRFIFIGVLVLIFAVAFLMSLFDFDFTAIIESIDTINYGIFAMIGCPLLVIILSGIAYKRIKD